MWQGRTNGSCEKTGGLLVIELGRAGDTIEDKLLLRLRRGNAISDDEWSCISKTSVNTAVS
jgi:hypothetical protein